MKNVVLYWLNLVTVPGLSFDLCVSAVNFR